MLRRGLEVLDRHLLDSAEHPALRVIGLAESVSGPAGSVDVAHEHDRHLANVKDVPIHQTGYDCPQLGLETQAAVHPAGRKPPARRRRKIIAALTGRCKRQSAAAPLAATFSSSLSSRL